MTEPHLKAVPDPASGLLRLEMDAEGFRLLEWAHERVVAAKGDDPRTFTTKLDRVAGLYIAGKHGMGWDK